MTRRGATAPAVDHARDRIHWVRLVADAHRVVEGDKAVDLGRLGDDAMRAASVLNPVAGGPRGLVCRPFAGLVHAYARQADAARRQALAPLMIAGAGMVDQLLAETEAAPVIPTASVTMPDAVTGSRLPYRED